MEIPEIPDAGHVFRQVFDRQRPLQGQVMEIVVELHGTVAAGGLLRHFLLARAGAMHEHPCVGSCPIDDAVFREEPTIVQHARVDGFARIDLRHVARGDVVQHGNGVRPHEMDLLEARNVHEPRLRANGDVLVADILGVSPRRAHAIPVFELRSERTMAISERGKSPGERHGVLRRKASGNAPQSKINIYCCASAFI